MPELENAVHALKSLNWSDYESKTFAALIYIGKSTASQITKKSNIPANRTYQILDKLIGKGYVKRFTGVGKPALFEAVDPHVIFDEWINNQERVLTFGRQGLYVHDNTHHAIYMAQAAAKCLNDDGSINTEEWKKMRKVFESHVVED